MDALNTLDEFLENQANKSSKTNSDDDADLDDLEKELEEELD